MVSMVHGRGRAVSRPGRGGAGEVSPRLQFVPAAGSRCAATASRACARRSGSPCLPRSSSKPCASLLLGPQPPRHPRSRRCSVARPRYTSGRLLPEAPPISQESTQPHHPRRSRWESRRCCSRHSRMVGHSSAEGPRVSKHRRRQEVSQWLRRSCPSESCPPGPVPLRPSGPAADTLGAPKG